MEKLVQEKVLVPGDQLPTVRQMAIDLRINFSTVARAYHILDEKKLISTQRGRGTYIWEDEEPGETTTVTGKQILEKDQPKQNASKLVNRFITEALRQGFTLNEIKLAFDQEIADHNEANG
jgi:GntR family transcriptional regulator